MPAGRAATVLTFRVAVETTVVPCVSVESFTDTVVSVLNDPRSWAGSGNWQFRAGRRRMVINHEVGHRLGSGHTDCHANGAPAPVMMRQTLSMTYGGRTCRPNA